MNYHGTVLYGTGTTVWYTVRYRTGTGTVLVLVRLYRTTTYHGTVTGTSTIVPVEP